MVEGVLVVVGGLPGAVRRAGRYRPGLRTGHDRLGALAGMVCDAAGASGSDALTAVGLVLLDQSIGILLASVAMLVSPESPNGLSG